MDRPLDTAPLLSDKDLADRWGLSVRTIKSRRAAGLVPKSVPLGRRGGFGQGVRYRLEDVIAFEKEQQEIASGVKTDGPKNA